MTSQVYVWPWRLSWTAVNLLTSRTFNKSHYLLGTSLFHCLMCEWNDSHDIMLLSTDASWRYKKFEIQSTIQTDSIENSPCTTSDCWHNSRLCTVHYTYRTLQGVLITGLSDRVSCSDCATGCKIRVSDRSRDMRFFSSLPCPDRLWEHPVSYSKGMWILPWG